MNRLHFAFGFTALVLFNFIVDAICLTTIPPKTKLDWVFLLLFLLLFPIFGLYTNVRFMFSEDDIMHRLMVAIGNVPTTTLPFSFLGNLSPDHAQLINVYKLLGLCGSIFYLFFLVDSLTRYWRGSLCRQHLFAAANYVVECMR